MKLVLFPGLGTNHRLFEKLRPEGVELVALDYHEPAEGQSLPAFALELAQRHKLSPEDAVGGASFGGMVATEIAAQCGAKALVLIGSALGPREIPWWLHGVHATSRIVPDACIDFGRTRFRSLAGRLGRVPAEDAELYLYVGKDGSAQCLRRGARMIFTWSGRGDFALPVHRIHGGRDGIIRPPKRGCEIVPDAGHLLMLSHAAQVSAFLTRALAAR